MALGLCSVPVVSLEEGNLIVNLGVMVVQFLTVSYCPPIQKEEKTCRAVLGSRSARGATGVPCVRGRAQGEGACPGPVVVLMTLHVEPCLSGVVLEAEEGETCLAAEKREGIFLVEAKV